MNKLLFFGTCAGTEPIDGKQHASFALETSKEILWFDAGEGCSRTAHLMGVDLLKVRKIFISHTHMDHIGGLGNLLWNIRKLNQVKDRKRKESVEVFIPDLFCWQSIYNMLLCTEGNFHTDYEVKGLPIEDGVLYESEECKVIARHNNHLGCSEGGTWLSYSFKIILENTTIVYSGDIKNMDDIDGFVDEGCDYLLMETGHQKIIEVGEFASKKKVKNLLFFHNGREIINDREKAEEYLDSVYHGNYKICDDKDVLEIPDIAKA